MNTPPPQCEFEAPPTPSTGHKHGGRVFRRDRLPSLSGLDEEPSSSTPATTQPHKKVESLSAADTTETLGLPTPAKTPSKKRKIPDPSIFASGSGSSDQTSTTPKTARLLFGEEIGRRARAAAAGKKANALPPPTFKLGTGRASASSSTKENHHHVHDDDEFEIYTDPTQRVPQVNKKEQNPFLEDSDEDSPAAIKKTRKARKAALKRFEAVGGNREDGMVYTFRGKKFFKKFDEDNPKQKIQPRLLFPSARQEAEKAAREAGLDEVSDEEEEEELARPTLKRAHSHRSSGGSFSSVMDSGKISKSGATMPTNRKLRSTPGKVDEVPRIWNSPKKRGRKIHFEIEEEKEVVEETVEEAEKVLNKKAEERKSKRTTKTTTTSTTTTKTTTTLTEDKDEDKDKAEEENEEEVETERESTPIPSTPKAQIAATPKTPPRLPHQYKTPISTPQRVTRQSHKRAITESPDRGAVDVGPAKKIRRRA